MTFTAEDASFTAAAEACHRLWSDEGAAIVDVWVSLWGEQFAPRQVQVESALRGVYDYESAWRWALSLSSEQRPARF